MENYYFFLAVGNLIDNILESEFSISLCGVCWALSLWRTGTISFNPTFGSFTLLELVSLVKVLRLFRLEQMFFWCSECGYSR